MKFNYDGMDFDVNRVQNRMEHKLLVMKEYEKIKDYLVFADSDMTIYTKTDPEIQLS